MRGSRVLGKQHFPREQGHPWELTWACDRSTQGAVPPSPRLSLHSRNILKQHTMARVRACLCFSPALGPFLGAIPRIVAGGAFVLTSATVLIAQCLLCGTQFSAMQCSSCGNKVLSHAVLTMWTQISGTMLNNVDHSSHLCALTQGGFVPALILCQTGVF